jgi:uncharacterized protein YukJ
MPLPGYGLLIGRITASRPPRRNTPHWLLMVQPGDPRHPAYRVAVNLQPTARGQPAALQYQTVPIGSARTRIGDALIKELASLGPTSAFLPADSNPTLPRLDFVRGSLIDPHKFVPPLSTRALQTEFAELQSKAFGGRDKDVLVAVFGTGYPIDPQTHKVVPTGYTGIENVHMNQGALNLINGQPHYLENASNQDGGLIFLYGSAGIGFFVKFSTQTVQTDANGNPTVTGIPELDKTSMATRRAIMPPVPKLRPAATRATTAPAVANVKGYVFADVSPADASGQYIPDNDPYYQTPFVMTQSQGHTRGPVPTPRQYPRLSLTDISGSRPSGYVSNAAGASIAFDVVGDSGAPSEQQLDSFELKVTDLMARDAQTSPPSFLFHVGDVVYFYGEENYYYGQFYEPFRAYPAPIFAIPGNHDGITYNASMVSLDSFQKAFCATTPGRWIGAGGILRSSMTQPGVYFTLDAPLVSIIGLYSNCGESFGYLDAPQLLFLYQELTRLKQKRQKGLPAVILAIHHFPRWFPTQKPKDPTSAAIDATCRKAGFWPDAVICGHAHLYQRVVRQDPTIGKDLPYVMAGAGGYGVTPAEEVGKPYMAQIASSGSRLSRILNESGYVRAMVTAPLHGNATLRFEYHSVKQTSDEPDDVCTVNLLTGTLE